MFPRFLGYRYLVRLAGLGFYTNKVGAHVTCGI